MLLLSVSRDFVAAVQASIAANTYVVSGPSQTKSLAGANTQSPVQIRKGDDQQQQGDQQQQAVGRSCRSSTIKHHWDGVHSTMHLVSGRLGRAAESCHSHSNAPSSVGS
jgi:hypothetical protein